MVIKLSISDIISYQKKLKRKEGIKEFDRIIIDETPNIDKLDDKKVNNYV